MVGMFLYSYFQISESRRKEAASSPLPVTAKDVDGDQKESLLPKDGSN